MAVDVRIAAGLGRFFANEMRASVGYALYVRMRELGRLRQAVETYRAARAAWVTIIEAATGVYRNDITFGLATHVRGHWTDRLPALDADLAAMEAEVLQAEADASPDARLAASKLAPLEGLDAPPPTAGCSHVPPDGFTPGQPLVVALQAARGLSACLHYRHVNHAESYAVLDMADACGAMRATIPGEYTDSPYALEVLLRAAGRDGACVALSRARCDPV